MRRPIYLLLILLVLAGLYTLTRRPVARFSIYGRLAPTRLEFQGQSGTAWKNITWEMDPSSHSEPFHGSLGRSLAVGDDSSDDGGGFLLDVTVDDGRVSFVNRHGARWDRLSVGCGGRVPCEFLLTEEGVSTLDGALGEAPQDNTPHAVVLRMVHAILDRDLPAFEACFLAAPPYDRAMAAQGRYYLAAEEFKNAFVAAYGYDAWLAAQNKSGRVETLTPGYYHLIAAMEFPEARDDTCRVALLGGDWPAVVVRREGRWLLSAPEYIGETIDPEANIKVMDAVVAALDRFRPAIGRPDVTAEDLDHEFDRALMAAFFQAPAPELERFQLN